MWSLRNADQLSRILSLTVSPVKEEVPDEQHRYYNSVVGFGAGAMVRESYSAVQTVCCAVDTFIADISSQVVHYTEN